LSFGACLSAARFLCCKFGVEYVWQGYQAGQTVAKKEKAPAGAP
jgi:hypothetical protein